MMFPKCNLCDLGKKATNIVWGEGNSNANVMLVGECPGPDEDKAGRPFIGRSGQLLRKSISTLGMNIEDMYITNVVKCFPKPRLNPSPQHVEACYPFLEEEIRLIKPILIVGVGKTASEFLLGAKIRSIVAQNGKLSKSKYGLVLTVVHPSYCLRKNISAEEYSIYLAPLLIFK